ALTTRWSQALSIEESLASKIVGGALTSSAEPKRNDSKAMITRITCSSGIPALTTACATVLYMRSVSGASETGVTAINGIKEGYSANTALYERAQSLRASSRVAWRAISLSITSSDTCDTSASCISRTTSALLSTWLYSADTATPSFLA